MTIHSRTRLAGDLGVPAALGVLGTFEMFTLGLPSPIGGVALEWVACAALAGRRRFPVSATLGVVAATILLGVVGVPRNGPSTPIFLLLVAIYSLGCRAPLARGALVLGLIIGSVLAIPTAAATPHFEFSNLLYVVALATPPFGFGIMVRRLGERQAQLETLTEELRRERELVRRAAATAERTRIARDVHDVIAHSVSAMVVQASAAEAVLASDPDRARVALGAVSETGRRALDETTRLMHLLRDERNELGLRPEPGLAEAPKLLERARRDGLQVRYVARGALGDLPAEVDVAAYRALAEVLTNARRYAADRQVTVRIDREPDALVIDARNNVPRPAAVGQGSALGATAAAPGSEVSHDGTSTSWGGSGLGLVGLRERVEALGGRLTTAQGAGQFHVLVRLPMGGTPT